MTIEVHQAELEVLIKERLSSGRYADVETLLLEALRELKTEAEAPVRVTGKTFVDLMRDSPWVGSGIDFDSLRSTEGPRLVEFE